MNRFGVEELDSGIYQVVMLDTRTIYCKCTDAEIANEICQLLENTPSQIVTPGPCIVVEYDTKNSDSVNRTVIISVRGKSGNPLLFEHMYSKDEVVAYVEDMKEETGFPVFYVESTTSKIRTLRKVNSFGFED